VRVPWLLRWPARVKAKQVSDALLGTPDIMPTLLSLLALPTPKAVEGRDLSAHALGQSGAAADAAYLQGMGTTAAWVDGTEWRAVRDLEYTYGIYRRDRRELLFDRHKDPYQLRNLAQDRTCSATLEHYRKRLQGWMKERNDTFESCTWYRDHWTKDRNIVQTATNVTQNLKQVRDICSHWFPEDPESNGARPK
jgi:arylsulfatase A-like enzyme